jgi:hypothetical protein
MTEHEYYVASLAVNAAWLDAILSGADMVCVNFFPAWGR